jgi:hypothetical protein
MPRTLVIPSHKYLLSRGTIVYSWQAFPKLVLNQLFGKTIMGLPVGPRLIDAEEQLVQVLTVIPIS